MCVIAGYTGLQVPSMRACPTCSTLIEHLDGCKETTCSQCDTTFCFVCLEKWDPTTEDLDCGIEDVICPIAPRQTELPDPVATDV